MNLDTFYAWSVAALVVVAVLFDLRTDVRRLVRGRNVVLLSIFVYFIWQGISGSRALRPYSQSTFDYAIFCVATAAVSFLVGYHATKGSRIFRGAGERMSRLDDPRLLGRVTFICAIIGFTPILFYADFDIRALVSGILGQRKSWGGVIGRGRFGDMRAALLMLEFFAVGAGPLALSLMLNRRSSLLQKVAAAPICIWPLLRGFGGGTRSALLASALPCCAVLYFKASPRMQRILIITTLVSSPLFVHLMKAIGASRNTGHFSWEVANYENVGTGQEMLNDLCYIIDNFPKRAEYQYGYSFYVQIVNPIPRFLWPGKPTEEVGIFLARLKGAIDPRTGQVFYSNSPGLIGEMYLNFGLLGIIFISMFGGWLIRSWDVLIDEYSDSICTMIFYCMGLASVTLMGRSFNASSFYGILALYLGTWALIRLSKKKLAAPAWPTPIGHNLGTLP